MWRSLGFIAGGSAAGVFLDLMRRHRGEGQAYAFVPVWQWVFSMMAVGLSYQLFRSWKRHGGDRDYRPPVPDVRTTLNDHLPDPMAIPGTDGLLHSTETVIAAARDEDMP